MEHHKTNSKSASELDRLSEDFVNLRDTFGDMFNAAMELGRDYPGEVKDKLHAGVKQLRKMAKEAKAQAVEELQDRVTERPLTSVAVCFGVGVLCGMILCRSK